DGDGAPDDLVFQTSYWPSESKTFVVVAEAPTLTPAPRVYVYHDEPRDDIAWESDRIAFRIYGEGLKKTSSAMSSNGIDAWVSRARRSGGHGSLAGVRSRRRMAATVKWERRSCFRLIDCSGGRRLAITTSP